MRRRLLAVTAVVLAGLGACTYSPDFANDKLVCGPGGSCPKGYSCDVADQKCWKTGEAPGSGGSDGGSNPGTGGAKLDAGSDVPTSSDPRAGFVGTWTFTGGTMNGSCTDGSVVQSALTGDYILIGLGTTASTVLAQYRCQTGWTMQLSGGNTMAVATSNQTCMQQTIFGNPAVTTTYTWSALAFSFTKTSGSTATATGQFMGPFTASDSTMGGSCDLTFSGPLTKN